MKVICTVISEVNESLSKVISSINNGDRVILHEGLSDSTWLANDEGVYVRPIDSRNNLEQKILLNGKVIYERKDLEEKFFTGWGLTKRGWFIVRRVKENQPEKEILLKGKRVVFEGLYDEYAYHPKGFIIRQGNKFLLNGKTLVYEGPCAGWRAHPKGVLVARGSMLLLNGEQLLYEGGIAGFQVCGSNFVVRNGNQFLFNGKKIIYNGNCDSWAAHPMGAIISYKGNLMLNGEKSLYAGPFNSWLPHDKGIFIRQDNLFFFIVHQ